MKLWRAIAFLCLIWAMIYLTLLGSQELRGEEARRILPAQEMLDTGDWVVPRIAGEVYSNKPPLINWMIAVSFYLTGSQSEFSARLPAAISVLALILGALLSLHRFLGIDRAMAVGLVLLTAIAMIDKGRMAEIETVYITVFGLACFIWVRLWGAQSSPWLIWTIPYFFLGLGWLTKGPVHLIFWILFLVFVLRSARRLGDLLHPAHILGLGIMALLFLPWMSANIAAVDAPQESVSTWFEQLKMRVDFSQVDAGDWLLRPFEILANFLPWTIPLLFSLIWLRLSKEKPTGLEPTNDRFAAIIPGALLASAAGCLVICLIPGGTPRYVMPIYPLAAVALVGIYTHLPKKPRDLYEKFTRYSLLVICPLLLLASLGIAVSAVQRDLSIAWQPFVFGAAFLVAILLFLVKYRILPDLFLFSSLTIAAGAMMLIVATTPIQESHRSMRDTAAALQNRAKSSDRTLVVYANSAFRSGYTKELRLLYYLSPELIATGESGTIPEGELLVFGRPGLEKALAKRGFKFRVQSRDQITIDGRLLALLELKVAK
ncbi:glycosyltransferase family 39 protein [bacterium]|nr:glycosyltransferase family 39 protein [bacterium]